MKKRGLYIFTQDLRLHDNAALSLACAECEQLDLVYIIDQQEFRLNRFGLKGVSPSRLRFIRDAVECLDRQLANYSQSIRVLIGDPVCLIAELIEQGDIAAVYSARLATPAFKHIKQRCCEVTACPWFDLDACTLYAAEHKELLTRAKQFTPFKKDVLATLTVSEPIASVTDFPPPSNPVVEETIWPAWPESTAHLQLDSPLVGGEKIALARLDAFITSGRVYSYQGTRNNMGDIASISAMSAYLATGSLSVRTIWQRLSQLPTEEAKDQASVDHFKMELLWREFFYWQLHKHGSAFFEFTGIQNRKPLQCFYPEFFAAWCYGNTGIPLVDANMLELLETGFISNRGRQIVASFLVNDMGVDWRWGAAWFQAMLVDYDEALNWGNWMYIAGVGHDPRRDRYFSLKIQSQKYDEEGAYICHRFPDLESLPVHQRHFPFIYSANHWGQPVCMPRDMR